MENIPILDELQKLAGSGGFLIFTDFGSIVSNLVGLLLTLSAIAAFLYLVLGGIKWLTSGGDKGKVEEARTQLTNAIIGLAIVAGSWAAFLLLNYFFGLGIAGASSTTTTNTGSSNSNTLTTNPPPGYCLCGNGECATNTQVGGYGNGQAQCYRCNGQTGGWDKTGGDCSNTIISCNTCP